MADDIAYRKQLARAVLSAGRTDFDELLDVTPAMIAAVPGLTVDLDIPFPQGLAPVPRPISPSPRADRPLPRADVVVVTWTVAERNALADVLTPERPGPSWYRYNRRYEEHYDQMIRAGAPSKRLKVLGTYFPITISGRSVLCFKSELHLNQDGVREAPFSPKNASLPVRDLFRQIIDECRPSLVLTVGTCGGIELEHDLGDVLVTRAAKFRCRDEFEEAAFNNESYVSDWEIPTTHFAKAEELMRGFESRLREPVFGPPTRRHRGDAWRLDRPYRPSIIHERGSGDNRMRQGHPILTTDFFEFGTSSNASELSGLGCGLEMGDAVLGLVAQDLGDNAPRWAVIRNISDPQINGELTDTPRALNMQSHWAVWYYEAFGYWTSVMSALTTWAIIAGLED